MNDVNPINPTEELVQQTSPVKEEIRPGQEVFYTQSKEQTGDESHPA